MRASLSTLLLLLCACAVAVVAFRAPLGQPTVCTRRRCSLSRGIVRPAAPVYRRPRLLSTTLLLSSSKDVSNVDSSDVESNRHRRRLFVLSFDGAVAATARHRARLALRAALEVWPSLRRDVEEMDDGDGGGGDDDGGGDDGDGGVVPTWLENKLTALAPVAQHGADPDDMLGCGAVMLARLVLEEQRLDGGRSKGTGKYGSKFHPRQDDAGTAARRSMSSSPDTGSRPLTVGEIFGNWEDLKDATRMRYAVDGGDPLPFVARALKKQYQSFDDGIDGDDAGCSSRQKPPSLHAVAMDALPSNNGESGDDAFIVLASHESHIPMAVQSLRASGISCCTAAASTSTKEKNGDVDHATVDAAVTVTAPKNHDDGDEEGIETHAEALRRIISEADEGTDVIVVHGALCALKRSKRFLGEDAPLLVDGVRTCTTTGTTNTVSLFLPDWADTVDPTQANEAEMDVWLNLLSEESFLESASSRIVSAQATSASMVERR